jgi:hypothetical protein
MFFTPNRHNFTDWMNGESVEIFASDPAKPSGESASSWWIKVPRGWQLFKNLPLWAIQGTVTNQDGETFTNWDVSKHLDFSTGKDALTLLIEFFDEFVNNPLHGDLKIWSNGTKSVHDMRFCYSDKPKFDGDELTDAMEHNSYISNFELRIF